MKNETFAQAGGPPDIGMAFTEFDRVYLAGPISGCEKSKEANLELFHLVHARLIDIDDGDGLRIYNPAVHSQCLDYDEQIKRGIHMLLNCTHILMLPGWHHSKGACTELVIAKQLGLKVRFLIVEAPLNDGYNWLVVSELLDSGHAKEAARQTIAEILVFK